MPEPIRKESVPWKSASITRAVRAEAELTVAPRQDRVYADSFSNGVANSDSFAVVRDLQQATLYKCPWSNLFVLTGKPIGEFLCKDSEKFVDRASLDPVPWAMVNSQEKVQNPSADYFRVRGLLADAGTDPDIVEDALRIAGFKNRVALKAEYLQELNGGREIAFGQEQLPGAIIITGGGVEEGKPSAWQASKFEKALELKLKGRTGDLLITTGRGAAIHLQEGGRQYAITESEAFARELLRRAPEVGVSLTSDQIFQEPWSRETIGNFLYTVLTPDLSAGPLLAAGVNGPLRVVTTKWQAARVEMVCRHLFGSGVAVFAPKPLGLPEQQITEQNRKEDIIRGFLQDQVFPCVNPGDIAGMWFALMLVVEPGLTGIKTATHETQVMEAVRGVKDTY